MIESITPLLLTYNEAPNIARTLERLRWARDIVVVDSFSDDGTPSILAQFPQVRLFQRSFDSHVTQWSYALRETQINSEWVLAMDADYLLVDDFLEELKALRSDSDTNGYRASFKYSSLGKILRRSLYPPVTVLYRRNKARYTSDGHTQQVKVDGRIGTLRSSIIHEDRKSWKRWSRDQRRYARLEAEKLTQVPLSQLSLPDRIRKFRVVTPVLVFLHCLFGLGLILDGPAGIYYSFQRFLAEWLLSICLIKQDYMNVLKKHKG